jgi:uncharacterized protein (TIRG00374 family)
LKDRVLNLLKAAISLGLVAFIFTRPTIVEADWTAILSHLRPWPWLAALGIYLVAIGFNVLKWQYLLRTLDVTVPFLGVFRHQLVGLFFANLPLSMLGGDVARGWDLARSVEGKTEAIAVSVLVDRLVGLAAFLMAAALGLAFAVVSLGRADLAWLLTTVALILAAFVVALVVLMSQRIRGFIERIFRARLLSRFLPFYEGLSDAVQGYRTHLGALAVALGLGLCTVLATCAVNYLAAATVGARVPFVWVLILTPLTPFALYIPSIASGLGVNQAVYVALYSGLAGALNPAEALAMSLAMQLIIYVASLPGAALWWRRRQGRTEAAADL